MKVKNCKEVILKYEMIAVEDPDDEEYTVLYRRFNANSWEYCEDRGYDIWYPIFDKNRTDELENAYQDFCISK